MSIEHAGHVHQALRPATTREASAGGAELVSRAHRAARCRELADAGYLVARIVPLFERDEAPESAGSLSDGRGTALRRGELREALEGAVEISLALRGALPPGVELDAPAEVSARDQLYRVRKLGAAGLCLVLPELRRLADAEGVLAAADSLALEVWRKLSADGPVVVLLDEGDRELSMLAPRALADFFAERAPTRSWPEDARSLQPSAPVATAAPAVLPPSVPEAVDVGWETPIEAAPAPAIAPPAPEEADEDAVGAEPTRPGKRVMASDPLFGLDIELCDEPSAFTAPSPAKRSPAHKAAVVPQRSGGELWAQAASSAFDSEIPPPRLRSRPRFDTDALERHAAELADAEGPRPVSAIEDLFKTRYMPLLEALSTGYHDERTERVVDNWRASFEKSYGDSFQTMRVTGRRPSMVLDAPDVASRLARQHGARAVQLLLVDGMRYDLGQRVQRELAPLLSGRAQCVEQTLFWSALPTVTPVQLHLLARGARALREEPPSEREGVIQRDRSVSTLRRIKIGQRDLLKLDLVEARLREAGAGFESRMSALAEEVADVIAHASRSLAARTMLFVFADHGFYMPIGGPDATGPAEQGNATPEEVLVGGQAWLFGDA